MASETFKYADPHFFYGSIENPKDPYLETKAKKYAEKAEDFLPGTDIVEHAGRVNSGQKLVCGLLVLGDNDLGVAGAVLVDVVHRLLQAGHQLHRAGQVPVLQAQLLGWWRTKGEGGRQART